MQTLNVALGERSYPIHIGAGLLARAELIVERLPQKKAAIITNTTVAPLYLAPFQRALEARGVEVVADHTARTARRTRTGKRSTASSTRCSSTAASAGPP